MPEKVVDNQYTTFVFPQKPEKLTWKQFIYNEKTGKVFGRTRYSWGALVVFYSVYFVILFSLFAACMQGLFYTLSDQYPKYQLSDSLIGNNPGLGFRPMPGHVKQGALVYYTASNQSQVEPWLTRIEEFLEPYRDPSQLPGEGKNQVICNSTGRPAPGKVCHVDLSQMGPCSAENGYGYNKSTPCIFVKMNRIYGWVPEYYEIDELPENMPADLVDHIKSLPEKERKQVWVSCNGISPADREIIGPIAYYPTRGFPGYFFPYINTPGYLSPLLAVQFLRPGIKQSINLECRVWAKNLVYRGGLNFRMGSVSLVLLID
nr:sodium/potassium-transporting ATPase subunit beta-1-like [Aedes albopictus]